MKKIVGILFVFVFLIISIPVTANAGGVVYNAGPDVFTSILHKKFQKDKYRGAVVERWVLIQTNFPNFDLNSAKKEAQKEKVEFTREFQKKYILKIHQELLNSFYRTWKFYFLAENDQIILPNSINLRNKIYVYRKQSRNSRFKVLPVVEYRLNVHPDIEINFLDEGYLSFTVTIPEVDESPRWNTFKYGGEPLAKFFYETVFTKYEDALKRNNHFK